MKPAIWRHAAERDVAEAAYWYAMQGGLALGEQFIAAIETGIGHVSHHPGSGSLRYSVALKLEGMRFWPVNGFPYLIFYMEHETQVDVWRVLHAHRDVPAWMVEEKSQ